MEISKIDVYGDSKVIFEWENYRHALEAPTLVNWMEGIQSLMMSFNGLSFLDIFREKIIWLIKFQNMVVASFQVFSNTPFFRMKCFRD